MSDKILLVGCGKMGGALLGGWLDNGYAADDIMVIDTNSEVAGGYGVRCATEIDKGFKPDTVVLAVKPQIMDDVIAKYAALSNKILFISIAAGKTIEFYNKHLNGKPIVRAMPNLPAVVGCGVTVFCANQNITDEHKERSNALFRSVGDVFWIEDEDLIDAVTAVSGSGPAYVFYFMECLINAGIKLGLSKDLATMLAKSTVLGSATLARISDKEVKELKEQVVSPKGTTEAGLKILAAKDGLQPLIEKTAIAACERSKELGKA
jgi:pyrroline-5-carboxylate reductase